MTDPHVAADIARKYANRDAGVVRERYSFANPEIHTQNYRRRLVLATGLHNRFGRDLSDLDVLDVGCGAGGTLRDLVAWGATASRCVGVDLLPDRIAAARELAPRGLRFIDGDASGVEASQFDIVLMQTVLSSLQSQDRVRVAQQAWSLVRPGGLLIVFDMRTRNRRNPDVSPITKAEIDRLLPEAVVTSKSLILAPPIARRLRRLPQTALLALEAIPVLRTHRFYLCGKPPISE